MQRERLMHFFFRQGDQVLAGLLGLFVFSVYLRTLCPTVYWGDCGELATVAATLGVPHPTGYPLYCLLGKAWTVIFPFGSIVWRLNVLSAVFGSCAVMCLYGFARTIRLPRPLALTAGGLLAFTSTFWQQCLLTETYTLAAFFTCLMLLLAARWKERGCRPGDLLALALGYGFTLTSHQTNTLFLPGYFAFILWTSPALLRLGDPAVRRTWAKTLGVGALPLLTYLYLPIRAHAHPAYNWGEIETPFAFWYHVTGRTFSQGMFADPLPTVAEHLLRWRVVYLPQQFPWPLTALCVLGLGLFWRQSTTRPLAFLLTWIALADIVFALNYSIYNSYIYFIPCYAVMSACAGRGLLGLWRALEPHLAPQKRPAYAAFGAACALALVPTQIVGHQNVSLRGNWTCYDYASNVLASVPPHGILIENGDDTAGFGVNYQQIVEGRRTDVVMIRRAMLRSLYDPRYGKFVNAWYLHDLKRRYPRLKALYPPCGVDAVQTVTEDPLRRIIRDAVAHGTPVCALDPGGNHIWLKEIPFVDDDRKIIGFDRYLQKHYQTAQIGLVIQVYPKSPAISPAVLHAETEQLWKAYTLRGVFGGDLQRDPYLSPLAVNYGNASLVRAKIAYKQGDYPAAAEAYSHVLSLFECDEATQGLNECRQRTGRVVASNDSP